MLSLDQVGRGSDGTVKMPLKKRHFRWWFNWACHENAFFLWNGSQMHQHFSLSLSPISILKRQIFHISHHMITWAKGFCSSPFRNLHQISPLSPRFAGPSLDFHNFQAMILCGAKWAGLALGKVNRFRWACDSSMKQHKCHLSYLGLFFYNEDGWRLIHNFCGGIDSAGKMVSNWIRRRPMSL